MQAKESFINDKQKAVIDWYVSRFALRNDVTPETVEVATSHNDGILTMTARIAADGLFVMMDQCGIIQADGRLR
jgi:hypothetical protein